MEKLLDQQSVHLLDEIIQFLSLKKQTLLGEVTEKAELNLNTALYKQRFLVKRGSRLFSINCDTIAYFLIENKSVFIRSKTGEKYLTEYRLDNLELILSPVQFFRVNRSLIISIDSIAELRYYHGGRLALTLVPSINNIVVVSRHRVSDFRRWLDL